MSTTIEAPVAPRRTSLRPQDAVSTSADSDIEPLNKPMIAELSNDAIEAMTSDELRRLIIASEHPWRGGRLERRLGFCDRETLVRLAFLARRCCRHQGY